MTMNKTNRNVVTKAEAETIFVARKGAAKKEVTGAPNTPKLGALAALVQQQKDTAVSEGQRIDEFAQGKLSTLCNAAHIGPNLIEVEHIRKVLFEDSEKQLRIKWEIKPVGFDLPLKINDYLMVYVNNTPSVVNFVEELRSSEGELIALFSYENGEFKTTSPKQFGACTLRTYRPGLPELKGLIAQLGVVPELGEPMTPEDNKGVIEYQEVINIPPDKLFQVNILENVVNEDTVYYEPCFILDPEARKKAYGSSKSFDLSKDRSWKVNSFSNSNNYTAEKHQQIMKVFINKVNNL